MTRGHADYINDIVQALHHILEFTYGMTLEEFENDIKTQYAVIKSIEIMGEAAKKIPGSIRRKYPEVPWKRMAGMRDKLVHEYHGVDETIVWGVATKDIPSIKTAVEEMANDLL
jgi:uncharacterized protein with HEPN domain